MSDEEVDTDARDDKVREKQLLDVMDRDGEIAALAALLEAEPFRDFLWRVLERCAVFSEAFDANFGKTGYMLGRQSIGRWLLVELAEANPEKVLEMQLKANHAIRARAREQSVKAVRRARRPSASP